MADWTEQEVSSAYNKAQAIDNNPNARVNLKNTQTRLKNTKELYIKAGGTVPTGHQVDHTRRNLQVNGLLPTPMEKLIK